MVYLDGHSTTPLDPKVFEAMKPYFLERFGNASHGVHRFNWEAEAAVDQAREQLAGLIGAHEKEIIFTSGATESNHLALLGLIPYLQKVNRKKILSIEIEHASLLGALEILKERGFEVEWVKTHADGRVDFDDLRSKLNANVGLVTIAFANHEIGTIQDVKQISQLARETGAIFHTDAVQALGKVRFDVNSFGLDLITMSGHKIHGPKGVGALYVRRKGPRVELEAIFYGGNQERGIRPGTPNTPGIVGFGKAAEIANQVLEIENQRLAKLRDRLWNELRAELPCLIRNGSAEFALAHNLNISVVMVDGAGMFSRFKNIAVSNASACLSGPQDYSQVLTVLGVEKDLAKATLRFGLTRFTTDDDITVAVQEVVSVVRELRKMEKEFRIQTGFETETVQGDCLK
jgi:cysteine desulfurase